MRGWETQGECGIRRLKLLMWRNAVAMRTLQDKGYLKDPSKVCVCRMEMNAGAPSGCPGLHVVQHGLKALHGGGVCVGQAVRQSAVKAERFELQPDETKTVLIKQNEEARGALWTRESVTGNQARPIEALSASARVHLAAGHDPQGQNKGLWLTGDVAAAAGPRLGVL